MDKLSEKRHRKTRHVAKNIHQTYGISGGRTSVRILIDSVFAFAVGADASSIFRSAIYNNTWHLVSKTHMICKYTRPTTRYEVKTLLTMYWGRLGSNDLYNISALVTGKSRIP